MTVELEFGPLPRYYYYYIVDGCIIISINAYTCVYMRVKLTKINGCGKKVSSGKKKFIFVWAFAWQIIVNYCQKLIIYFVEVFIILNYNYL